MRSIDWFKENNLCCVKKFQRKSTRFSMLFPLPLVKLEQSVRGGVRIIVLSNVLCTELIQLGHAPVYRGFLTVITLVLRVPLCVSFVSVLQLI